MTGTDTNDQKGWRGFITRTDQYIRIHRLQGMTDILLFVLLTLCIHYLWRFWENRLGLVPVHGLVTDLMDWLSARVLHQSTWMLNFFPGYHVTISGHIMHFPSGYDIAINRSCSGLKQIMQFVLLMIIFRGKWQHKLWFIPLGVVLVHITNLFRIYFSGILSMNRPEWMQTAHDQVLRWMFYLVICGLWLIWVKKIARRDG